MKYIIIISLLLSPFVNAGLNYSQDGKILDPGMYWAIHARNELADYKKSDKKGKSKKTMKHLRLSASFGFKDAMRAISAIYQNGDYGFEKDLPKAFAWSVIANGSKNPANNAQFNFLNELLTQEQHKKSLIEVDELYGTFSKDATFKKFEKWYQEVTAVTGSKLPGDHSYLNVQITTSTGRKLTAFEFYNQVQKIYKQHELDNQEVIQHEIVPVDD